MLPLSALCFAPFLLKARVASVLHCDTSEYNVSPRTVQQVHVPLHKALGLGLASSSSVPVEPVSLGTGEEESNWLYVYSTPVCRRNGEMWVRETCLQYVLTPPPPHLQDIQKVSDLLVQKHEVVCKWTYTDRAGMWTHVVDAMAQTVQDILGMCFSAGESVTCILHTELHCSFRPSDEVLLLQGNSATMVTIWLQIKQGSECSRTSIAALRCSIESITSRPENPQAWARMAAKCFELRPSTKMV